MAEEWKKKQEIEVLAFLLHTNKNNIIKKAV